ncbi:MAG TPA: sialate O-acetylesterase [Pirellulales bacterium]|jgi:sialate O-acetylesterase
MTALFVAWIAQAAASTLALGQVDRVQLVEDYQVLQRDRNDRASCVMSLPEDAQGISTFVIMVKDEAGNSLWRRETGSIELGDKGRGVPIDDLGVGGPYIISIASKDDPATAPWQFRRVLVGDIWILGGQSNMFGIDRIKQELPAVPYLNILDIKHIERDSHWCAGVPPIHRIPESLAPFIVKAQHPEYSEERIRTIIASKVPVGGIDCSYFFARALYAESGVPIGLIPCATGGALAIWNPQDRATNRYGFLLHHIMRAGGRVKGMLFFQGEQDAIFGDKDSIATKPSLIGPVSTYSQQFKSFVESLRGDVHDPDMPVIFAQICRHHNGPTGRDWAWEAVREAQRRLPETLAHSYCVPSIDLNLMDGLHLDDDSLQRMGQRMARLALPYTKKGVANRTEIRLKSVTRVAMPKPRIVLQFSGVNGRLQAPGRPTGFVFKMPNDELVDWVFKAELDPDRPDSVILWTTTMPDRDVALFYGAGSAPYVNIVDDEDMPLPALGPIVFE